MSNFKPKTVEQLRAIFGLGKKLGMDKEELEELASVMTNGEVERLSLLTFDQANQMIKHLGGDPISANGPVPRRTENYRKQKAGVQTIESGRQLKLIRDLAATRNISEDGLAKLATRMHLPWPPNTTRQGNKITEALKAMIKRDQSDRGQPARQEAA